MTTLLQTTQNLNSLLFTLATTGAIMGTWYVFRKYRDGDDGSSTPPKENGADEIITHSRGTQTKVESSDAFSQTISDNQQKDVELHSPSEITPFTQVRSETSSDLSPVVGLEEDLSPVVRVEQKWEAFQQSDNLWVSLAQLKEVEGRICAELVRLGKSQGNPNLAIPVEDHSPLLIKLGAKLRFLADSFTNCPPWLLETTFEDFLKAIHLIL